MMKMNDISDEDYSILCYVASYIYIPIIIVVGQITRKYSNHAVIAM